MPAISVIMPVFNGTEFLDRAITSLRAQTFVDWELIAVDDGSTDGSVERLEKIAASDNRIRVFCHPDNRGVSAARNTALAQARGQLIAYLDCDDEYYPDYLAHAHDWRDKGEVLIFRYDQRDERNSSPMRGEVVEYDPATRYQFMFTETIASPLSVVHHRNLLDRTGMFDESLSYGEDGDLWRRFGRVGAPFTFVPHKCGLYHIRSDSLSRLRPNGSLPASGLTSPVVHVDVRAGEEHYLVRIPQFDTSIVSQIFERHEYGGAPLSKLRSPPVILDIGANVGTFAIYVKLCYRRDAVIHCFEPYPPTIELLRQNVIPFPDVTIHPVALGRADAETTLWLHSTNESSHSVRTGHVLAPVGQIRVQLRDAGAMWDELGLTEIDILKIDAEASEIDILESLGARLSLCRVIFVEFHSAIDRRRIDALLSGHELFSTIFHSVNVGVVKYIRADLLTAGAELS